MPLQLRMLNLESLLYSKVLVSSCLQVLLSCRFFKYIHYGMWHSQVMLMSICKNSVSKILHKERDFCM